MKMMFDITLSIFTDVLRRNALRTLLKHIGRSARPRFPLHLPLSLSPSLSLSVSLHFSSPSLVLPLSPPFFFSPCFLYHFDHLRYYFPCDHV